MIYSQTMHAMPGDEDRIVDETGDDRLRSDLVDLTGLDLAEVKDLPPALLTALGRLFLELDSVEEPFFVEFQSSAPG